MPPCPSRSPRHTLRITDTVDANTSNQRPSKRNLRCTFGVPLGVCLLCISLDSFWGNSPRVGREVWTKGLRWRSHRVLASSHLSSLLRQTAPHCERRENLVLLTISRLPQTPTSPQLADVITRPTNRKAVATPQAFDVRSTTDSSSVAGQ